jgi:hypothetical protein
MPRPIESISIDLRPHSVINQPRVGCQFGSIDRSIGGRCIEWAHATLYERLNGVDQDRSILVSFLAHAQVKKEQAKAGLGRWPRSRCHVSSLLLRLYVLLALSPLGYALLVRFRSWFRVASTPSRPTRGRLGLFSRHTRFHAPPRDADTSIPCHSVQCHTHVTQVQLLFPIFPYTQSHPHPPPPKLPFPFNHPCGTPRGPQPPPPLLPPAPCGAASWGSSRGRPRPPPPLPLPLPPPCPCCRRSWEGEEKGGRGMHVKGRILTPTSAHPRLKKNGRCAHRTVPRTVTASCS